MIEEKRPSDNEQLLSSDDVYLAELANRILKLRMLHEEMESKPEPWAWIRTFSE